MSEELSVSFQYSTANHAAALAETRTNRLSRRWIRFCAAAMALMAIAMAVLGATLGDIPWVEILKQTGPLFAFSAAWFAVPSALQRYQRWSLVRRGANENAAEVCEISADGFRGSSNWTHPVP
jgi:hypothetical protein